jgi:hypothetical protein
MAVFVARFERSTEPERTNIADIRRGACVSLRTGTGWFGFAIASAERRVARVADVADIKRT